MLWELEIFPQGADGERLRVAEEYDLLTHAGHGGTLATAAGAIALVPGSEVVQKTSRGFLLQGDLNRDHVEQLMNELLVDPIAERGEIHGTNARGEIECGGPATVLLKPGVMDPVAMSVIRSEEHTSELQSRGLISYAV